MVRDADLAQTGDVARDVDPGAIPDRFLSSPPISSERLIPLDSTGVVTHIDRAAWEKLSLWPGRFPGFIEAWITDRTGGTPPSESAPDSYALYILYTERGVEKFGAVPLRRDEMEWLRARVGSVIDAERDREVADRDREGRGAGPGDGTERDPSARNILITGTTVLGLGFYSWGVPVAGDLEGGRQIVASSLLTISAAVVVPFILTANRYVPPGATHLALYGATRGGAHGAIANRLFTGDRSTTRKDLTGAIIGSVVEGVGGYFWAQQAGLSPGRTHLIEAGGDLGLLGGVGLAEMLDLQHTGGGRDRQLDYATMLGGAAVGLGTGALLGPHWDTTWGDAEIIRTASIVSAGLGGSLMWAAVGDSGDSDTDTIVGAALATGLAGAWLGNRLTDDLDFKAGEAVMIDLMTIAGGALGGGLAYLATTDNSDEREEVIAVSAAVGAGAGFGLLYRGYRPRAARRGDTGALEGADDRGFGARGNDLGDRERSTSARERGDSEHTAGRSWSAGFTVIPAETREGRVLVPGVRVSVDGLFD